MAWQVEPVGVESLPRSREAVAAALPGERDDDDLVALVGADDPFKDQVVRLEVEVEGTVAGTAIGHLEGPRAYLDLIAVHPDLQRQGIGRALLERFEAIVREQGAASASLGGSVRRFAWPGVSMVRTQALSLALRHGYHREAVAFDMWLDLDDDVAPTARDLDRLARRGITCRLATEEDLPGLRRAAAAVLGTTGVLGGVWGDELTAGVRGARSGVYVATLDGEIRAFAGFSIYRSTMFGPTGTEGDLRGSGIGEVLLRLALDTIRARGATHAEIGWVADGALPFYSRTVGATCGAAFWILTKPLTG